MAEKKYLVLGGHERLPGSRYIEGTKGYAKRYVEAEEVAKRLGLDPAECVFVRKDEPMLNKNPAHLPLMTMNTVRVREKANARRV